VLILEQRIAHLEGRVVEQANTFEAIRDVNAALVCEVQLLNARLDREMQLLNARLDREMQLLHARINRLEQRFVWMFGLQATTFVAIVVALFAR
jgi:uncharacterized coiled-coil protein SlyX